MSDVAEAPAELPRLQVAGLTDVGMIREHNEDCLGDYALDYSERLASHGLLFAVADGMGGHALGEVASRLAIDTLFDAYYHAPTEDLVTALYAAVEAANALVYHQGRIRSTEMGTTLAAALFHGATMMIASVGDSRVYRLREGRMQQLTQDHSLVAEQLRRGIVTAEQAQQSRSHNVLTRCLGLRPVVDVDVTESPVRVDDFILICSDGLHGLVTADEMATMLLTHPRELAVRMLIDLANSRGGVDNITCLVIQVAAVPEPEPFDDDDDDEAAETDGRPTVSASTPREAPPAKE